MHGFLCAFPAGKKLYDTADFIGRPYDLCRNVLHRFTIRIGFNKKQHLPGRASAERKERKHTEDYFLASACFLMSSRVR